MELPDYGEGILGDDVYRNKLPPLPFGTKIFISHGYFSITLLGLQITLYRQASTVDVAVTGVRIQNLP